MNLTAKQEQFCQNIVLGMNHINRLKGIQTEDQISTIKTELENKITGGSQFEEFLRARDTSTRAVFIYEKMKDMPDSEKGGYLKNLVDKKILTEDMVLKVVKLGEDAKQPTTQIPSLVPSIFSNAMNASR